MPRPRNELTSQSIIDASWRLFGQKGYAATSYSDISDETGINRATVQKYFPKKGSIARIGLERLRDCSERVTGKAFPDVEDLFSRHYILGQIYLASLMCCDDARGFLCDVLQDRALVDESITGNLMWSTQMVTGSESDTLNEAARQDIVFAMGGLYELMYYSVTADVPIDIPERMQPMLRAFAAAIGIGCDACEKALAAHAIEPHRLQALGLEAYRCSFQSSAESGLN